MKYKDFLRLRFGLAVVFAPEFLFVALAMEPVLPWLWGTLAVIYPLGWAVVVWRIYG